LLKRLDPAGDARRGSYSAARWSGLVQPPLDRGPSQHGPL